MKWCEVFQCWCDDVDDIVDEDAMQYCIGFGCDGCDTCANIEFK